MIPLILSTSTIKAYLDCHYRYYLSEVLRLNGLSRTPAALGTAVHAGIERGFRKNWLAARTEMTLVLDRTMVRGLDEEQFPVVQADGLRMMETYQREVVPTFTPTLIEAPFLIKINGVHVSGHIDAADEDVHDTKTVAMISKFRPDEHVLQMTIYRRGYQHLVGRLPKRLLLDVLPRGGRVAYRQYEVQPDEREMVDVLGIVRDEIMQENYEPTGAISRKCFYCPYLESCRYAVTD